MRSLTNQPKSQLSHVSTGFLNKSQIEAQDFLKDLTRKTLQSETTIYESLGARISFQKEGTQVVVDTSYVDTCLIALENILKGIVLSQLEINIPLHQVVSCSQCHAHYHTLSACLFFAQLLGISQQQVKVNVAFQRLKAWPLFCYIKFGAI